MTVIRYDTSFGFDKNIIVDNLAKFTGSFNIMSGVKVSWDVRKTKRPKGLAIIQWDIDIVIKPDKTRDIKHLETAIITWDREQPEQVYKKAMEAILDKLRDVNIDAMNEQNLTYTLED